MTGPEHYREAERLLAESRTILRPNDEGHCEADRSIAEAQVHATLALAAATAIPTVRTQLLAELKAWAEAASTRNCEEAAS
jgi:quinolinate synthase